MPTLSFSQIQPYLAILLPFVLPYLADMVASILRQDGFDARSPLINESIAWAFLIVASVASGIVDNQLLATPSLAINTLVSIATLLLSGPLTNLAPWVNFTGFLQSKLFNVIQAEVALATPQLRARAASVVSQAQGQGQMPVTPRILRANAPSYTVPPRPVPPLSSQQQSPVQDNQGG